MAGSKLPGDSGGLKQDALLTKEQVDDKARQLLAQMSLKEKIQQMSGSTPLFPGLFQVWLAYNTRPLPAGENTRLSIPAICFTDGPRGVVMNHSSCFPVDPRPAALRGTPTSRSGSVTPWESKPGPWGPTSWAAFASIFLDIRPGGQGSGNIWGGSLASGRELGSGPGARHPAPRHGRRQTLRSEQHRRLAVARRCPGKREDTARSIPAALQTLRR